MLVMSKGALSAGQAATYYEEKYSRDDYYTEQRRVAGRWFGKAASELGLTGEIATEDFRAALSGLNPKTGETLVHAAQRQGERRAGWDATFNAPKSVSVQALVGGDPRLIAAHRAAVEIALSELENFAQARIHRGQEWVTTANVVAARFDHIAARPSENAASDGCGPDPHLHTHVVVMNMTRRSDGAWRGLDPVEIYRSQAFATAVYRAELARQVQKLGYAIGVTGRDGRWELEGYSREQVMAFSQRRQDIEQELARLGVNGAEAAQIAAHRSRLAKDHRDEEALKTEWRQRADAHDIKVDGIAANAVRHGSLWGQSDVATLSENVRVTVAHATERDAVPDRRELETFALQHTMGRSILEQVRGAVERYGDGGKLIAIAPSHRHPIGSFTTPEMAVLESNNIALMHESQGKASAIAGEAEKVRRWAARRGLAADQTAAAEVTLSTRNWLSAIDGRAGAAKTTTVGAIREFAQEQGFFVRGFGPTSGSVKALTESGVLSRTVASLLENLPPDKHSREFWIVDESSLLATRQVNRLLHLAKDAGINRIVFVGDHRQHHAIEAGRPVYQMQQAGMAIASLNVIRRQRDPELRRAVELASAGKAGEVIEALRQQDRITQIAPAVDRYRAIANDYLRSYEAGQRTLVVSPANEERRELNRTIRELLVERGQVERDGFELPILTSLDLTRAQRAHARHYAVGDVVRFRRGSVKLGIERGSYATVEASDAHHDRLTIRTSAGAAIEYAPERLRGVEVFRPESRTLAVGDRIQFRTPDRALNIANGEFATVAAISSEQTLLQMDDGRELKAATPRLRHVDYGYASTSHSSQGATVDRVIVNIDTTRSVKLVNQRQFYVSISRARHDARIYTDDANALARAVGREQLKPTALEHLSVAQRSNSQNYRPVEVEDPAPARRKQGIRQEQKRQQGNGIRW